MGRRRRRRRRIQQLQSSNKSMEITVRVQHGVTHRSGSPLRIIAQDPHCCARFGGELIEPFARFRIHWQPCFRAVTLDTASQAASSLIVKVSTPSDGKGLLAIKASGEIRCIQKLMHFFSCWDLLLAACTLLAVCRVLQLLVLHLISARTLL